MPSPLTQDVKEWIEYIDKVIAFQCDDDRYPNAFQDLYTALKALEDKQQISTFNAFNGYLEDVVLQGYDESADTQIFELNEVITLFNLDFCNSIDSPREITDKEGNIKKVYKFDAVNKLLEIQKSLSSVSTKFILYLTVQCSYKGGELAEYLKYSDHSEYVSETKLALNSHEFNARIVRLFVIDTLSNYFKTYDFTPKFFPTIYYEGDKGIPLLHFTVIGSKNQGAGSAIWYQDIKALVRNKFITIENNAIVKKESELVTETDDIELDPVVFFSNSDSFKKIWQAKKL